MTVHELVVNGVDRIDPVTFRVAFGCTCGGYTAEETAPTEAGALAMAANGVRIHEAKETGSPSVDIRF